jgi:hypothetical protein
VDGSLAANAQFPANQVAGLTTPPPQNQEQLAARFSGGDARVEGPPFQPISAGVPTITQDRVGAGRLETGAVEGGSLLRRGVNAIGDSIAADVDEFTSDMRAGGRFIGNVGDAAGQFIDAEGAGETGVAARHLLGQIIGPPIEDVANEAGAAFNDLGEFTANFFGMVPDDGFTRDAEGNITAVPVEDAGVVDNLNANDGTGVESIKTPPALKAPPIAHDSPDLLESQGLEPVEVIRGTNRSLFFPKTGNDFTGERTVSQDLRRGLEVPEGFDEASGARIGRLMQGGRGMSMGDAIAAMDAQDQTAASAVAAGAAELRAYADAASNHTDAEGNLWITQIQQDGTFLMTNTGVSVLEEAKVGQMKDPLGNVSSFLLYPSMVDRLGNQQYGAVPLDELGIDPDDTETIRRAEERWRELIVRFSSDDVIDAMIAEGF